jgi:hypothetical protein
MQFGPRALRELRDTRSRVISAWLWSSATSTNEAKLAATIGWDT